jgi:MFS family permease
MSLDTTVPVVATASAGRMRLQLSLMVNFFLLMALYSGVLGVLLPNQIAALNPGQKANNLALMFAITSVFSTLTTPIAGALSDRTRTRWGRRSPWIAIASLVGSLCLFGVSWQTSFWSLMVLWVMATVAYNAMQPAMTTVIADRFAPETRGVVSGVVGAGMTAGLTAGTVVAGYLAGARVLAYGLFAVAIAVSCLAFVLINREASSAEAPARPFSWKAFAASFWISPKDHPDFAWAFAGRFTVYMGYQAVAAYLLYILRDYIGLSDAGSNIAIANLAILTLVCLIVSSLASGFLSDRLQSAQALRRGLEPDHGLRHGRPAAAAEHDGHVDLRRRDRRGLRHVHVDRHGPDDPGAAQERGRRRGQGPGRADHGGEHSADHQPGHGRGAAAPVRQQLRGHLHRRDPVRLRLGLPRRARSSRCAEAR